ncbi:MAG: hypothetical protein KDD01_19740 [Phaeodactylibacter sp.]|nr:hypothetical protein [Phaeodactylibacter sp.]
MEVKLNTEEIITEEKKQEYSSKEFNASGYSASEIRSFILIDRFFRLGHVILYIILALLAKNLPAFHEFIPILQAWIEK